MDSSHNKRNIADSIADIADLCLFGILWLLLLIPVFTAGAATSALYKMHYDIRREKPVSVKLFFAAFRGSFRNAFIIEIIMLLTGGVLAVVFHLATNGEGLNNISVALRASVVIVIILWWMIFSYAYAYTAFFQQTVRLTFYNSLVMGIVNIKNTIIQMVLSLIIPLCYYIIPGVFLRTIPVIALLGIPLIFWGKSGSYMKVFRKYISK